MPFRRRDSNMILTGCNAICNRLSPDMKTNRVGESIPEHANQTKVAYQTRYMIQTWYELGTRASYSWMTLTRCHVYPIVHRRQAKTVNESLPHELATAYRLIQKSTNKVTLTHAQGTAGAVLISICREVRDVMSQCVMELMFGVVIIAQVGLVDSLCKLYNSRLPWCRQRSAGRNRGERKCKTKGRGIGEFDAWGWGPEMHLELRTQSRVRPCSFYPNPSLRESITFGCELRHGQQSFSYLVLVK
eukprot:768604-Hanusia_phi.AAC.2